MTVFHSGHPGRTAAPSDGRRTATLANSRDRGDFIPFMGQQTVDRRPREALESRPSAGRAGEAVVSGWYPGNHHMPSRPPALVTLLRIVIGSLLLVPAPAHAGENPLDGYGTNQSYTIPYLTGPEPFGTPQPGDPYIPVTMNGVSYALPLDTGSRGFIIDQISANLTPQSSDPWGQVYYNSSNRVFRGQWSSQTLSFPTAVSGGTATGPATVTLPVLIIEAVTVSQVPAPGSTQASAVFWSTLATGAINVRDAGGNPAGSVLITDSTYTLAYGQFAYYSDNPYSMTSAANFGIGFDRTGNGTTPNDDQVNQQYNPFLNVSQMLTGGMTAGYVLRQNEVQLGLTGSESGYAYTNLVPTGLARPAGVVPDWQAPTGSLVFNGTAYGTGQIVIDTGIGSGIMNLPGLTSYSPADTLTVNLLNSGGAVSYDVNTDPNNWLNPCGSIDVFPTPIPGHFTENQPPYAGQFFNTGRNVLNAFDVLYDGQNGFFGLKPNGGFASQQSPARITFNAGFYPTSVPEIDPAGLGSVLAFVAGISGLLERRRRRAA